MAIDSNFLDKIKTLLLEQKDKIEIELKSIGRHDSPTSADYDTSFPDYGDKEDENASEVATYTDNLAVEKTLETRLRDTLSALSNLVKGNYGKCKYCGEQIDERRLLARPESGSCVKCKQKFLHKM